MFTAIQIIKKNYHCIPIIKVKLIIKEISLPWCTIIEQHK